MFKVKLINNKNSFRNIDIEISLSYSLYSRIESNQMRTATMTTKKTKNKMNVEIIVTLEEFPLHILRNRIKSNTGMKQYKTAYD